MFTLHLRQIAELVAKSRLPTMGSRDLATTAGLMSYDADSVELWRRAATYVAKILKGAKPADLPIEQPMTFELVVNVRTAKVMGLTIPPSVLARADEVLQ